MELARVTWLVVYDDGSILYESDTNSPLYYKGTDGTGEVPKSAIEWRRVRKIVFEAPSLGSRTEFDWDGVPEGLDIHMKTRVFKPASATKDGVGVERAGLSCMMVITVPEGTDPKDISDETVVETFFWMATGKWHLCDKFNCGKVGLYGHNWCNDKPTVLPETCDEE